MCCCVAETDKLCIFALPTMSHNDMTCLQFVALASQRTIMFRCYLQCLFVVSKHLVHSASSSFSCFFSSVSSHVLSTYYVIWHHFYACSQICEKRLLASSCPSIHMKQLGSHWMDFDDIWYLGFFWKSVANIQVSLKFDKKNIYFTWRHFHNSA